MPAFLFHIVVEQIQWQKISEIFYQYNSLALSRLNDAPAVMEEIHKYDQTRKNLKTKTTISTNNLKKKHLDHLIKMTILIDFNMWLIRDGKGRKTDTIQLKEKYVCSIQFSIGKIPVHMACNIGPILRLWPNEDEKLFLFPTLAILHQVLWSQQQYKWILVIETSYMGRFLFPLVFRFIWFEFIVVFLIIQI